MGAATLDRDGIETAWHSETPIAELCERFGAKPETIHKIWQRARKAGRLPEYQRFEGEPVDDAGDVVEMTSRIPAGDPYLAALRREHGNDRRRLHDDVVFPVRPLGGVVMGLGARWIVDAGREFRDRKPGEAPRKDVK